MPLPTEWLASVVSFERYSTGTCAEAPKPPRVGLFSTTFLLTSLLPPSCLAGALGSTRKLVSEQMVVARLKGVVWPMSGLDGAIVAVENELDTRAIRQKRPYRPLLACLCILGCVYGAVCAW